MGGLMIVRFYNIVWGDIDESFDYVDYIRPRDELPKDVVGEWAEGIEFDAEDAPEVLSEIYGYLVESVDVEWVD